MLGFGRVDREDSCLRRFDALWDLGCFDCIPFDSGSHQILSNEGSCFSDKNFNWRIFDIKRDWVGFGQFIK